MTDRSPLRPRKPITMGSFAVVAVVALVLFVPTFSAHVAVMNVVSIDATPTDYALSEDGDHVVVEIRIHNPTRSGFTASYGQLYGKADGEQLTGLGVEVEETTIPSGETRTLTARLSVEEGNSEAIADAIDAGRFNVTGQLDGSIQNEDVEIEVTEGEDG